MCRRLRRRNRTATEVEDVAGAAVAALGSGAECSWPLRQQRTVATQGGAIRTEGEPTAADEGGKPQQPPLRTTTRQCSPTVLTQRRSTLLIPKTEPRAQTACQLNSRQSAAAPPEADEDGTDNSASRERRRSTGRFFLSFLP